jgi:thiol-disulfide isomerase/thioredoxin
MKPYKIIIILLVTGLFFLIKPVSFTLLPDPAVEVIDVKKLKEIINNRNGKPLLVNVWATWCVPCREEFPELVKITDKFR